MTIIRYSVARWTQLRHGFPSACLISLVQHASCVFPSPAHRPHITRTSPAHRPHIARCKKCIHLRMARVQKRDPTYPSSLSGAMRRCIRFLQRAMCGRCAGDVRVMCGRWRAMEIVGKGAIAAVLIAPSLFLTPVRGGVAPRPVHMRGRHMGSVLESARDSSENAKQKWSQNGCHITSHKMGGKLHLLGCSVFLDEFVSRA